MGNLLKYIITDPIYLGLVWSLLGLGVFVAYRILDVADLSVEAVLPVSAISSIIMLNNGINPFIVLLITILIGIVCGLFTASLNLYLKIPPLLSGIIVMTGLFSVVLVFSGGYISINNDVSTIFTPLMKMLGPSLKSWTSFASFTIVLGIIVTLSILILYYFFGTNIGVAVRATGKNKTMAKAQGINTNLMVLIGMAISSALVALTGGLLSQIQTDASSDMGKGTIVIGLAILFLGESVFRSRTFKMHLISIVVGGYAYWLIISSILLIPHFDSKWLYAVQGGLIILILVIPELILKICEKVKNKKKMKRNSLC